MNKHRLSTARAEHTNPPHWWHVGLMWLVVGGPLAVVVASFATLGLAILNPDPVLAPSASASASEQPAVQARNHAATARP